MYYFKCVLLIDDDPINNIITEELLRKLYICDEICIFTNAKEGLNFIEQYYSEKNQFPELILVDINMPDMDGFEFVKTLNDKYFTEEDPLKVSALTSSSNPKDKELMYRLGVSHYIIKPLTNQKVKELIKAIN